MLTSLICYTCLCYVKAMAAHIGLYPMHAGSRGQNHRLHDDFFAFIMFKIDFVCTGEGNKIVETILI